MQNITLHISGMSCSHCLNAVNRAVTGVPGVDVRSVTIGRADLTVADDGTAALVKAAIEEAGYKVEGTA